MRLRTLAAIAAASALPALAGTPHPGNAFDFSFSADMDELLADASMQKDQWIEYGERMHEWADDFANEMQGSMAFMFSDRVGRARLVKGAPYSADAVAETNQVLADGNVITHQSVNKVYRDSQGRTRQETYRNGELRTVFISDPVAGMSYTLVPKRKLAVATTQMSATPRPPRERSSGNGAPDAERERNVVVRKYKSGDEAEGTREEVRVRVVRVDDDKDTPVATMVLPPLAPAPPIPPTPGMEWMPPMVAMPGVHTMRFESTAHLGKGVTTKLAARDFEGVKAEGTSVVWTIPANQIGNRRPINITRETWTSPELQVTVYSRYGDPRTGESIYRLASIRRDEPAADLFRIPEGYTTKAHPGAPTPPPTLPIPPTPPAAPLPPARG